VRDPAVAAKKSDAFLSGQYVCLRQVSPTNDQRKAELTHAIQNELSQPKPNSPVAVPRASRPDRGLLWLAAWAGNWAWQARRPKAARPVRPAEVVMAAQYEYIPPTRGGHVKGPTIPSTGNDLSL
jgi:hypothetical protein